MEIEMAWLENKVLHRTLTPDERSSLACLQQLSFKTGERIISEGQPGGVLYILRSGKVNVEDNNRYEGRISLAELEEGALFGELTFLNNKAATADVTALEDCIVYKLSQNDFSGFFRNQQQLAYQIFTIILEHQSSVIMSQRVTIAPMLRKLKNRAQGLPMFVKIAPIIFLIIYIVAFLLIPGKY
jgi:CRP-like cAMP-binding protein